jgi:hypothetical protein
MMFFTDLALTVLMSLTDEMFEVPLLYDIAILFCDLQPLFVLFHPTRWYCTDDS